MDGTTLPSTESQAPAAAQASAARAYLLLAVALAIAGLGFVLFRAWVTDDAFITMRYVMNVHAGNGPVFNAGERVQGFTHPLWFLILLAGSFLVDVYAFAVATGLALSIATTGALAWFLRRRPERRLLLILAFVALFSSRTFVEFQTSGLETSLTTLLVTILFGRLASRVPNEPVPLTAVSWLCALLLLTRPDLAVLCTPILIAAVVQWRRDRRAGLAPDFRFVPTVLGPVLILLAWYGFATIYYGSPLPNTAYAKVSAPLSVTLPRALTYARVYLSSEPLHLALMPLAIICGLWSIRRSRGETKPRQLMPAALSLALVAHLAYVFAIGGDFMRGRFFLPVLVGSIVLLAHSGAARALARRENLVRLGLAFAAVVAVYSATHWIEILSALVDKALCLLLADSNVSLVTNIVLCMLAGYALTAVAAAYITLRIPRRRRTVYVVWLLANAVYALGLIARYGNSFDLYVAGAALVVGSVAVGCISLPKWSSLATLSGILAAGVCSLSDLQCRDPMFQNTGVADEWVWYCPKHWTNPFVEPVEFLWPYETGTRTIGDLLRRYAESFGSVTLEIGNVGILPYHAGPNVRIIDKHGLTDAFVARGYEDGHARVGHPDFEIPTGYPQSNAAINLLPNWRERLANLDPTLIDEAHEMQATATWPDSAAYDRYQVVQRVISGPLLSRRRLADLPRFILPRRPPSTQPSP